MRSPNEPAHGFPAPTIASAKILTRASARAHIMAGFVAAIIGVILSLIAIKTMGTVMLASAAVYAVIAFGLWNSSRVAAFVGLLMSLYNVWGLITLTKGTPQQWLAFGVVLLVIAYWSALRGAIAEHRLRDQGRTAAVS